MPNGYSNVIVLIALIYRIVGLDLGSCSIETIIDYENKILEKGREKDKNFKILNMPKSPEGCDFKFSDFYSNKNGSGNKASNYYHLNLRNLFKFGITNEELFNKLSSKISDELISYSTDTDALMVLLGDRFDFNALGKIKGFVFLNAEREKNDVKSRKRKKN